MGHTGAASPVVKLLIRPQTPTGPGAGNHKRTSPAKDTKSVRPRVTPAVTGLQPSSNHQAASWILTVRPERAAADAQQSLPPHLAESPRIINFAVPQDGWPELGELAVRR